MPNNSWSSHDMGCPVEVTSSYTYWFHSFSYTVGWPYGSALSDGDDLIGPSSCPSREVPHTCSSVLFPLDLAGCGWGEDIEGGEESTDRGNVEGNLFLQPWVLSRTVTWQRLSGLQCGVWQLAILVYLAHLISLPHIHFCFLAECSAYHKVQSWSEVEEVKKCLGIHHHGITFFLWPRSVSS